MTYESNIEAVFLDTKTATRILILQIKKFELLFGATPDKSGSRHMIYLVKAEDEEYDLDAPDYQGSDVDDDDDDKLAEEDESEHEADKDVAAFSNDSDLQQLAKETNPKFKEAQRTYLLRIPYNRTSQDKGMETEELLETALQLL